MKIGNQIRQDQENETQKVGSFYNRIIEFGTFNIGLTAGVAIAAYFLNSPVLAIIDFGLSATLAARSVIGRTLLHAVIDAYVKSYFSIDTTKTIISYLLLITSVADKDHEGNTAIHHLLRLLELRKTCGRAILILSDENKEILTFLIRQYDGDKALLSRNHYSLLPAHHFNEDQLRDCPRWNRSDLKKLDETYISKGYQKFAAFKKQFNEKNQRQAITTESFAELVKGFKSSFDLKSIRKGLSTNNVFEHPNRLLEIFYADPHISEYLSRQKVPSKDSELIISKSECSFYKRGIMQLKNDHIPFRKSGDNGENPITAFYDNALGIMSQIIPFSLERSKIENMLSNNIHCESACDIYAITTKIKTIENQLKGVNQKAELSYYVMPGFKEDHAYLTAAIFDAKTGKSICTLLINSWQKQSYFTFLKERFETNNNTCPFIDCSIHVQTNEKDANCGLYTNIFGRALVQLFYNQEKAANEVFKSYQNASLESKAQAEANIQTFIRSKIAQYLPEYFVQNANNEFEVKSIEELRDFHMQKRWEIGNVSIKEMSQKAKDKIKALYKNDFLTDREK